MAKKSRKQRRQERERELRRQGRPGAGPETGEDLDAADDDDEETEPAPDEEPASAGARARRAGLRRGGRGPKAEGAGDERPAPWRRSRRAQRQTWRALAIIVVLAAIAAIIVWLQTRPPATETLIERRPPKPTANAPQPPPVEPAQTASTAEPAARPPGSAAPSP
ncbi:MAG: hypothetical protein HY744_27810 [Deltaproteobacteria bacterium]|nr:hypothetical protein [Deltaproteobacteria bacterium]